MHDNDLKEMKSVEEILEKELRAEMKKISDAGQFTPGQTKTLTDAVCLMLKMKEYEEWLEDQGMSEYSQRNYARSYGNGSYGNGSYAQPRSTVTGRFVSHGVRSYNDPMYMGPMSSSYDMGYSGHSTRDRMVARLEDMMGEAKNDYEAQLIRDTIMSIQSGK